MIKIKYEFIKFTKFSILIREIKLIFILVSFNNNNYEFKIIFIKI